MADNATFIPAPPGLTVNLTDGTQLPIVAFRVEGTDLFPHCIEKDGSVGQLQATFTAAVTAAWNQRDVTAG